MLAPISFLLLVTLSPPQDVMARDRPNDNGKEISVFWSPSGDTGVTSYRILRQTEGQQSWDTVGMVGRLARSYADTDVEDGVRYRYVVLAASETETAESEPSDYAVSTPQWFDTDRIPALFGVAIFTFLIVLATNLARRNRNLFIRRISGLDAVEEALGRATEMGRPILYVPGLSSIADVATIASLNILGEVAKKTAKFGTPLMVPLRDPIVYTVAREVVKESYTTAGRPDAFSQDMVFFVTTQQFAYAAACNGIMVRDRPATNFFIGMFWAESLILAETGATTGAIQIAGSDAIHQLPFFITACDYTLIGEELYAASAYLSREPLLLGSIKGQDYSKIVILTVIVLGTMLALLANVQVLDWFRSIR
ncbi:MAG: fibronectin type III domain-containing protein [candidate division WOR-3 bacterium]|nr:MAG: fibronectin type III domain-containing protein [candidate division WOR-3 bacterium]